MLRRILRKNIPVWIFLIAIIGTASAFAGITLLPTLLFPQPNFTILSDSQTLVAQSQRPHTFGFTLKALNGFTGVLLVQILTPSDIQASVSPSTASLANVTALTVNLTPSRLGNETVTLVASTARISHSMSIPVFSEDMGITLSSNATTAPTGSSAVSQLTLSSLNGLSGNILLTGILNDHVGSTAFQSSSVFLPSHGTVSTQLSVGGSQNPGTYCMQFDLKLESLGWTWSPCINITNT